MKKGKKMVYTKALKIAQAVVPEVTSTTPDRTVRPRPPRRPDGNSFPTARLHGRPGWRGPGARRLPLRPGHAGWIGLRNKG